MNSNLLVSGVYSIVISIPKRLHDRDGVWIRMCMSTPVTVRFTQDEIKIIIN